jgi:serine/threonine protein kinase
MPADRHKKLMAVIDVVMDAETSEQGALLSKLCAGDDGLLRDAEELLRQNTAAKSFMEERPPLAIPKAMIGRTIGSYRIMSEIGAGGMGSVYLAERSDGAFHQTVALKVIKRGMDSDAIVERFLNERRILASLEHPNIARLIDGGTTEDDLPYFVMEYVEGDSIMKAASARDLDLDQRLVVFRKVCSAVSFAHRNLVIHRDLKPSNILITNAGDVKLLDFGIAKLLRSEEGERTATQNAVFTPEYASPEQVRGEPLTTATDIYSLGVILYELLTGCRPYKTGGRSINEVIKAVCDTEPEAPSSVVSVRGRTGFAATAAGGHATNPKSPAQHPRSLRGDLDNIILKALRKEPERRYSSVEQLSEDIKRRLDGLPVTASADTWAYRASKFARRNRLAVVGAALILISLLTGLSATLYQRNRAQARFNDVRAIANSFLFEFHEAIKDLPGSTPARELVVKRALEYLDKLSHESESDKTLQRELATAYAQIGQIQGNSYYSNLGDSDGAMKSYLRSFELRRALASADPANRELQHELAEAHAGVGDMHYTLNDLTKGLESYEQAVAIGERLVAEVPANLEYKFSLAVTLGKRGDISGMEGYPNLGDTAGALESYKRSFALFEDLIAAAPANEEYQSGYATIVTFYGMLQNVTGDAKGAITSGRRSIATYESLIAKNPNNTKYETGLMATLVFMRYPLVDEKLFEEALANANRVLQTMAKQLAVDPKNASFKRSLGVAYNALGRIQTQMDNGAAALENHHKAIKIAEELLAADPQNRENLRDRAMTLEFAADAEAKLGDCTAAIASYRKASKSGGLAPGDDLAASHSGLGKCLAETGRLMEAADSFRQFVPLAEKAAAKSPLNVKKQTRLAVYYLEGGKILGRLAAASGRGNSAIVREKEQWLEKGYRILKDLERSRKLSKLDSRYLAEGEIEVKKLGPLR